MTGVQTCALPISAEPSPLRSSCAHKTAAQTGWPRSSRAGRLGHSAMSLYGQLLAQFIENKVFPADIENELVATLHNPGASSCSEEGLVRILRNYDPKKDNLTMIEAVAVSSLFKLKDGRVFKKGERLRKRYKCEEIATKRFFLFSPVYEVEVVN